MQYLSNYTFDIHGYLLSIIAYVLHGKHVDDFANGIVADMFLEDVSGFLLCFVLVPFLYIVTGQTDVVIDLWDSYLLFEYFYSIQNSF